MKTLVVTIEFLVFSALLCCAVWIFMCASLMVWICMNPLIHTSNITNSSLDGTVSHTQTAPCCLGGFCLFLYIFFPPGPLVFVCSLSLSHCLIVRRLKGIGLILITHGNTLTSPLLSLHWSLVPKPLTSYWQGAPNSASVCVCVHALSYRRWHAVEICWVGDLSR